MPGYLVALFMIIAMMATFSLLVYGILSFFYTKAPRKLKIEASAILGFIGFVIIFSRALYAVLIALLILAIVLKSARVL